MERSLPPVIPAQTTPGQPSAAARAEPRARSRASAWLRAGGQLGPVPLLTALPFLLAWLTSGSGRVFAGALINPQDTYSYLAKMREGADGAWLYTLPYTSETHPGVPIFLLYLLLGKLAAGLQLPLAWTFHGARLAAGCVLLAVALRYLRHLLPRPAQGLGWWLVAFGSGFGWLGLVLFQGPATPDLLVPEMTIFPSILYNPHQPLAVACWLGILLLIVRAEQRRSWAGVVGAGALAAALAQLQPFQIMTLTATLGGWLAWRWWDRRRFPWWAVRAASLGLAMAAPVLAVSVWPIYTDPVLQRWTAQNNLFVFSPSPLAWLLGLGLLGPLAGIGLLTLRPLGRRGAPDSAARSLWGLTVIWVCTALVLISLPLPQARRLSEGFMVPLALLATLGLAAAAARLPSERGRRLTIKVVAGLATLTNVLLLLIVLSSLFRPNSPLYLTDGEQRALSWLRTQAEPQTVVLAAQETSLLLPTEAPVRIYFAHEIETLDAKRREAAAKAYFRGALAAEERTTLLREGRVRYVFRGPSERRLGTGGGEGLTTVYEADDVTIYVVP